MSAASSSAGGTINNCIPPQNSSSSSCTGPTGPNYPHEGPCKEWPPSMTPPDSRYPYPQKNLKLK